jgi:hypothetical protein
MELLMEAPFGVIENFQEVESIEQIVEILKCFVKENEMLLFAFATDIDSLDLEDHKQLIKSRTKYINQEWVLPWDPPNKGVPEITWYNPKNNEEMIDSVVINQLFLCVVLGNTEAFSNYSYVIRHIEEVDSSSLCFTEVKKGDFKKNVFPRIKSIINEVKEK